MCEETEWYINNNLKYILDLDSEIRIYYKYLDNIEFFEEYFRDSKYKLTRNEKYTNRIYIDDNILYLYKNNKKITYCPFNDIECSCDYTGRKSLNKLPLFLKRYEKWKNIPPLDMLPIDIKEEILSLETSNIFFYVDIILFIENNRIPTLDDCLNFCKKHIQKFELLQIEKIKLKIFK